MRITDYFKNVKNEEVEYIDQKYALLNNEQLNIVKQDISKNILTIACAGSGKTTTMLHRVLYLLDNNIKLPNIIITTFTRDAANEMYQRLKKLLCKDPKDTYIGTIDSISLKLLREYSPEIFDENFIHVGEFSINFLKFLKENPLKVDLINRIKYIFVDEFQDLDEIHFEIINEFYKNGVKIFAVGDDAQNIYSFRGTSIKYIMNFKKYFDNSTILTLNINYRSTKNIVDCANESISKNEFQIPKRMISKRGEYHRPKVINFKNNFESIEWIRNHIIHLKSIGKSMEEIAILSPTNYSLNLIEEDLVKNKIPTIFLDNKKDFKTSIKKGFVILSTIHKSKGLEFETVIIIEMNDDTFPPKKSGNILEESRRLFYVGLTRAKKDLFLLSYEKTNKYLSRFITEIPKHYFDFINVSDENIGHSDNEISKIELGVTKLIEKLTAEDYDKLRESGIFNNIQINTEKIYERQKFPQIIDKEDLHADYGIFIDALICRMIDEKYKKEYKYYPVLVALSSITLTKDLYMIYKKYYKIINIGLRDKLIGHNFIKKMNIKTDEIQIMKILQMIYENSEIYKIHPLEIPVFTKTFIPQECKKDFINQYKKYYTTLNYEDVLRELWTICKCDRIIKEYRRRLLFKEIDESFLDNKTFYQNIKTHFIDKLPDGNVYTHLNFMTEDNMSGECDALINDILIEFKTSNSEKYKVEWLIQVLVYSYMLYKVYNKEITKIICFNSLMGIKYEIEMNVLKKGKYLYEYLCKKIEF